MPQRVRQNVDLLRKTSFSETRSPRGVALRRRSPRGVALRRRSPRRPFECPCDQCQGYAANDPGEPDPSDAGDRDDGDDV